MQRYFVSKENNQILFLEQDIFHIKNVMRNKIGDHIEIVIDGDAFLATITSINPLEVEINEPILKEVELNKCVTLWR